MLEGKLNCSVLVCLLLLGELLLLEGLDLQVSLLILYCFYLQADPGWLVGPSCDSTERNWHRASYGSHLLCCGVYACNSFHCSGIIFQEFLRAREEFLHAMMSN